MKKFGIIIFIVTALVGIVFASFFSFGKVSGKFFSFSLGNSVRGSGQSSSEIRDVRDFDEVEVGGAFLVEIVAGKDFGVEVEADDNLVPLIRTEVRGGVLRISTSKRLKTENPMRIRVSAPSVESVDASGASSVSLSTARNRELRIESSGASKVQLNGETELLSVIATGASNVDAASLRVFDAKVSASGASHVDVFASRKLVSDATGASEIKYAGNPTTVEKTSSGASRIHQK